MVHRPVADRVGGARAEGPTAMLGRLCQPWLASVVFCLVLSGSTVASAAGYWVVDRGPSLLARGGADIADPQGPLANYSNPAALAGLPGLQLNVDVSWVKDSRRFLRSADEVNPRGYDAVQNSNSNPPTPGMFLSYNFARFGLPALSMGAALYGPPKADREWPLDGPQRYQETRSRNLQKHYGLAFAYEFEWRRLRLGVSGQGIKQTLDTALVLNAVPEAVVDPRRPEDTDFDFPLQVDASSGFIPSAILAASLQPFADVPVTVSAVYHLPYDVLARGSVTLQLSGDEIIEGRVETRFSMPGVARLAVLYGDPQGAFDVEVAAVWEQWSRNQVIVFSPKDLTVDLGVGAPVEVPEVRIEQGWRDTFSIRLGGAYRVIEDRLRLRGGLFYESSAVPPGRTAVSTLDLPKVGLAGGGRVDFVAGGGLWFDFAAGVGFWLPRTVTGGKIALLNPLTGNLGHVVNNGNYSNTQFIVLLGVGLALSL